MHDIPRKSMAMRSHRQLLLRMLTADLFVRRYWYILQKYMDPPDGPLAPDVVCRAATLDDCALFDCFSARRPSDELANWIHEPDTWLFLAFVGGRPVGYDCVTRHVPDKGPFSAVRLAPDQVWVRDVYTLPKYRRHRVRRTLRACRVDAMRALGYRRYVAATAEDNVSALIATYDSTVEAVAAIQYTRILIFRKATIIPDASARLEAQLAIYGRRRRAADELAVVAVRA